MMATTNTRDDVAPDYQALVQGAALQLRPDAGVLTLGDADRADFLQRMTTNDIVALRPGRSAVTVLTSPTARILFVFTVLHMGDVLWLLPARGEASALERHLRGQIFFMDKVKVRNVSTDFGRMRLMGPRVDAVLSAAGLAGVEQCDGAHYECHGVAIVRQLRYDIPGVEIIAPVAQLADIETSLVTAGAELIANDAAYIARRIELGRPLPGAELTPDYNPLEVGMGWACAENKGCYTGQEIIARQITYDKVTRTLVSLRSEHELSRGDSLTVEGREVGVVTSAGFSPTLGAPLALGVVKRPHNQPGAHLQVNGSLVVVEDAGGRSIGFGAV